MLDCFVTLSLKALEILFIDLNRRRRHRFRDHGTLFPPTGQPSYRLSIRRQLASIQMEERHRLLQLGGLG